MEMAEKEKGDTASSKEGEAWGTLEELLLACAVGRHGTKSWDSIAMEVQKRTNSGNRKDGENYENYFSNAFTPRNCEQRYDALKRRFNVTGDAGNAVAARERLSFMVDELRKLRVEELRRELERHDVSIVSLQLKVKSLEEEREKSLSMAEPEAGETDLETRADRSDADDRRDREPDRYSAEVAGDPVSSGRSFNESNSTSQKGAPAEGRESNQKRESDEDRNSEPDPVLPAADFAPEKDCSSSRRGGGDGGYGLKEGKVVGRTSPPGRLGNSGELRESVSESKREGKDSEAKQSSDVQSSASLSKRKRRGWRRNDGVSSGDEIEAEERSPANRRTDVKSQPLIKFLEIVRSHKHGLVFQRRLPSQETEKYRNLIRQHMDLETVQSKLDRGVYCDCHPRFYRDILLVFTNSILFFCKSSTENAAARELRKLVMKEIAAQRVAQKPKPTPLAKPDLESQILDTVVKKPRSSTNIVVCRRRTNSSAMKPSSLSSEKNVNTSLKNEEEVKIEKLNTKPPKEGEKKTKVKTTSSGSKKSNDSKKSSKEESSDEEDQPINKRRKQLVSRKQGVVNFLKRIKQNSPSKEALAKANNTEEAQEEKGKKGEIGKKKVAAGKKKEIDDGKAKKRISGRGSTKGEEVVEKVETVRRGSGRPPTRKAAMGSGGTPDSGRLKRGREAEKEAGSSGKNTVAKKRTRR